MCNGCRAPEREIGYANMRKSNLYMTATVYLARSAKLPTGLYILPSVISSFFSLRQIISGSTGPIFTIFSPNERYLREFSRSGPLFLFLEDVATATDFGQNLQNDLYSTCWHFATISRGNLHVKNLHV